MNRMTMIAAASLVAGAHAQAPRAPDPADPKAAVPALRYETALAGYRPAPEAGPAPWKSVNERVGALGGHAGHLKALEKGVPAAPAAAGAAKPPAQPRP